MSPLDKVHPRTERDPCAAGAIWGTWLFLVLVLAVINPLPDSSLSLVSDVVVILHATAAIIILVLAYPRNVAFILAASLALRTALVFWDINLSHVYRIIHSGGDSEVYYGWSISVANNLELLSEDIRGGVFSKMFGALIYLIGPTRVFAQYTNALFGLTIALVIYKILRELGTDKQTTSRVLSLAAFLPNSVMLSAVYLRESVIAMLLAVSLLYFVRWFIRGGPVRVAFAITCVLAASAFHAGVIAIALGYVFIALFYQRARHRFRFGMQSLPYLALFAVIAALTVLQYPDLFLGKFEQFETESDLLDAANRRWGGSAYLTELTVASYTDLLLLGPIRGIYFLGSPMPWDIRTTTDALAFALDSVFYLGTILLTARNYRGLGERKPLAISLLVIVALATLVFGAGVGNTGTALRHRMKLLPFFLVMLGVAWNATSDSFHARKAVPPKSSLKSVVLRSDSDNSASPMHPQTHAPAESSNAYHKWS